MAKNAAAKLKKSLGVKDCDDLVNLSWTSRMPSRTPTIHLHVIGGSSKGVRKEDLPDDEEDAKEEEANEK